MSRSDYNDLGDSFQKTFTQVANKYFITEKDHPLTALKRFQKEGLILIRKLLMVLLLVLRLMITIILKKSYFLKEVAMIKRYHKMILKNSIIFTALVLSQNK
jgi:hypothetical protein